MKPDAGEGVIATRLKERLQPLWPGDRVKDDLISVQSGGHNKEGKVSRGLWHRTGTPAVLGCGLCGWTRISSL